MLLHHVGFEVIGIAMKWFLFLTRYFGLVMLIDA